MYTKAYEYTWTTLVEGQVYMVTVKGHLNMNAAMRISQDLSDFIETSPSALVHLISDLRQTTQLPSLSINTQIRHPYNHPHMGFFLTLQASQNPVIRSLVSLTAAVVGFKHIDMDTLTQACTFLGQKDPRLPPLEMWNIPALNSDSGV